MKATLTQNLFRRPQPTNEVEAVGHLDAGSVIEVVETVHGKPLDGNDIWHKAREGFFLWGGGVEVLNRESLLFPISFPITEPQVEISKTSWAHSKFGILDIWNQSGSKGENVNIAVLDSGIDETSIEFDTILAKRNFNSAFPPDSVHDLDGHGTQMTGIIAANGRSVFGVSPKSRLLIGKMDTEDVNSIIEAVKWAVNNHADIISMSFERRENNQLLFDELIKCKEKGIAIICAAGNGGQSGEVKDRFPASHSCCYSIGACDQNFKKLEISNLSNHLKLLAPGTDVLTAKSGGGATIAESGSSIATAYTSGIVALLLSIVRKNNPNANGVSIIEKLIQNTTVFPHMNDKLAYGNGVINPFKTFSQL